MTAKVVKGVFGSKTIVDPERTYAYFQPRAVPKKHVDDCEIEHTQHGFRIWFCLPDGTRTNYYIDCDLRPGAEHKFVTPGGERPRVYFPEMPDWMDVLADPSQPIIITEGPVKGIALAYRGIHAICINGVHGWHTKGNSKLLPDFDLFNLHGREAIFVFDHDVLHNPLAQSGLKRLGKRLNERQCKVSIVEMPDCSGGKTGVDDYLSSEGLTPFRKLLKARESFESDKYRHWGLSADPHPTDTGRAKLFRDMHGEKLRYNKARDTWYIRRQHLWLPDAEDQIYEFVRDLIDLILADAADELDKDSQKKKYKNALALEEFRKKESMLREAGTMDEFRLPTRFLDADDYLLGVQNGVLDLRAGELLQSLPPDTYITKVSNVSYDPDAKCNRWLKFLDEIFAGDDELVEFIQRLVGYSLSGDTSEQCLATFHGYGANGKSTLTGVLKELLGDYCRTIDVESLMAKRYANAGGPKEDIARLAGSRLVLASETEESRPLAESLVKQMTGGEMLTARELYKNSFEFRPQFKIVLVANHIPIIKGTDEAIWRRIRLVPFNVTFPKKKQDPKLLNKLLDELPGILNWALEGFAKWRRYGLTIPKVVQRATASYRSDMDIVGRFLEECAELGENYRTSSKQELYAAFECWCEGEGIRNPMQLNQLGRKLKERGISDAHSGSNRFYKGVRLTKTGEAKVAEQLKRRRKFERAEQ